MDSEPVDIGYRDTHDAIREKYRKKKQEAERKKYVTVVQVNDPNSDTSDEE